MTEYIYVLECERGKFYVGKTTNPYFRLKDHFSKRGGSYWTSEYKPLRLITCVESKGSYDELCVTLEYMEQYGIENVRGGPFCEFDITNHISTIELMLNSISDRCYICGQNGHFARDCSKKTKQKQPPPPPDPLFTFITSICKQVFNI